VFIYDDIILFFYLRIFRFLFYLFEAMEFGAPPHGGIAWGFDRLMMILEKEPNIREVIAFAKSGDGKDFMMNAPTSISEKQKKELGISK